MSHRQRIGCGSGHALRVVRTVTNGWESVEMCVMMRRSGTLRDWCVGRMSRAVSGLHGGLASYVCGSRVAQTYRANQ